MTRPPKRARSLRVDDALWDAALAAADERGEVLSEEIRKFLAAYTVSAREDSNLQPNA